MGIRCANHATPLYPQNLALSLLTSGGRLVGIFRSQTKATGFNFFLLVVLFSRPPLWSSGQSAWLQILRPGLDSQRFSEK
jgi:hypothetical protein